MKRPICLFFAFVVLWSFVGCQKKGLPQPAFPLDEDVVTATLEQTGLPGVISKSETQSSANVEGHILYTVRDPTETYGSTENEVLVAGISSAITEEQRYLSATFSSDSLPNHQDPQMPFAWEDWKQQIVFTTLLFGGFADEEEVYRAFFDKKLPEGEEETLWKAELPGGYCTVRCKLHISEFESSSLGKRVLKQAYWIDVKIYESKALYEKIQADMEKTREALASSRAERQT